MAVIAPTITEIKAYGVYSHILSWAAIADADTCTAFDLAGHYAESVQIAGTFGGATITITGSNDGTNYKILNDPQGNNLSKTTADLEMILENVRYIKPTTASGVGSSITVTILLRRAK